MGTVRKINSMCITWENKNIGYKYRVFVSKDGIEWGAKDDEQSTGALNPKADADYQRVKWLWFANQATPVEGRYVKIVPDNGYQLSISKVEVLGEQKP